MNKKITKIRLIDIVFRLHSLYLNEIRSHLFLMGLIISINLIWLIDTILKEQYFIMGMYIFLLISWGFLFYTKFKWFYKIKKLKNE